MRTRDPNIVVLGGGTGSFALLQDLKNLTPNISAIVNMCDDGGSTGVLRDEYGVLPPGDVRQCLVALSDSHELRNLFNFRFGDGRFEGQSLGNIILSGLELQQGSFDKAVSVASDILQIHGRVVPVTLQSHTLVLQDGGREVRGENKIGSDPISSPDARLSLDPVSTINPAAKTAIEEADLIVLAPGNLFGSILPIFAVHGAAEAIADSKGKVVSVTNLVTKPGQTDGWHVVDFVKKIESYLGQGAVNYVLYNNEPISDELIQKYASEGELPVAIDDDRFSEVQAQPMGACLVSQEITQQDPNDTMLRRTLIRHDGARVGKQLKNLIC